MPWPGCAGRCWAARPPAACPVTGLWVSDPGPASREGRAQDGTGGHALRPPGAVPWSCSGPVSKARRPAAKKSVSPPGLDDARG